VVVVVPSSGGGAGGGNGAAFDHSLRVVVSVEPSGRITRVSDELVVPLASLFQFCWVWTRSPFGAMARSTVVVVVPTGGGGATTGGGNGVTVVRDVVVSKVVWAAAAPVINAITDAAMSNGLVMSRSPRENA
jgi:hypothetical protein